MEWDRRLAELYAYSASSYTRVKRRVLWITRRTQLPPIAQNAPLSHEVLDIARIQLVTY